MLDLVPLVILARLPEPGRVKTRLCPDLHATTAAAVYEAFLTHLVARLVDLKPAELIVAFDPPDAEPKLRTLLATPAGVTFIPQSPGDPAARFVGAFDAIKPRHPRMLFVNVDSPDLPADHLRDAARLAMRADVVLGPTDDGSFWCLGLSKTVDAGKLLANVEWQTGHEAQQIVDAAGALHYPIAMADGWDDIERPSELQQLVDRLATATDARDRAFHDRLAAILKGDKHDRHPRRRH